MAKAKTLLQNKYELRVMRCDNRLIVTLNENHTIYNEDIGGDPVLNPPHVRDITSLVVRGKNAIDVKGWNDEGGGFNPYTFKFQIVEISPSGSEELKVNIYDSSLPYTATPGLHYNKVHPFDAY